MSYLSFLGLLSYFTLSELKPFTSWSDITVAEWILIAWIANLALEEVSEVSVQLKRFKDAKSAWQRISDCLVVCRTFLPADC